MKEINMLKNKIWTIASIFLIFMVFSMSAMAGLDDDADLVAFYKLNETTGTTAVDSSSFGFDATLNNFDFDSSGGYDSFYGTSVNFDGVDDYISAPTEGVAYNSYTVSFFAKFDQSVNKQILFTRKSIINGGVLALMHNTSELVIKYDGKSVKGNFTPVSGSWNHYLISYDNGVLKFYVDGVEKASISITNNPEGDFVFGSNHAMTGKYFDGLMDEIRVYRRVLSASEISIVSNIMQNVPAPANSLVAHYKLDETTGTDAENATEFGFDGTLIGFDFSTHTVVGVADKAVSFDGVDDYVQAEGEDDFTSGGKKVYDNFSVACFTSFDQVDKEQVLLTRQDGTGVGYAMIKLLNTGEVVSCYGGVTAQTVFFPNIGEWHHYAMTYDNGSLKVYVDGIVQVTSTVTAGTATGDFIFGANKLTTSGHLNGSMDDIRIYNYACSSSEMNLMSIHPRYNAPANSIITHYKLDESTGTVAGNASAYGYDGTLNNFDFASSGGVSGVSGSALDFDGVDDHLQASKDGFINTQIYNRFTLACFARFNQVDVEQVLATRQDGTGVGYAMIKLLNTGEVVSCYGGGTAQTGFFPNIGEWHHYAMTYDNGSLKVYVDGIVQVTSTVTAGAATGDYIFGADKLTTSGHLNGSMDDIRIYNYARSSSEVNLMSIHPEYNAPSNSLITHYKLNETVGTVAENASTYGFDGTLNNFDFASSGGVSGVSGKALDFDGIDDHINASEGGFINTQIYNRFTLACFVRFNQVDKEQVLATRQDGTGVGHAMIKLLNTGEIVSCFGGGTVQTGFFPNSAEWHHYAMTYDNASLKVYVDGIVQVTSTVTAGTATGDFIFGANKLTTSGHLNGSMDDIRIYNYACSSSEMNLMSIHPKYNAPANSLITHYKLDESTGTVAGNASAYGYDGTLNNFDFASSGGVSGVSGKALDFDGIDDHINASEDGFINTQIYNRFTLACFARFNQVDVEQVLATRQDGTGVGYAMIKLLNTGEVVSCYGGGTVQTGFFPNTGEWHHYAMTYDNGSLKVYVDGIVQVTSTVTAGTATGDYIFGADKLTTFGHFNGSMDDIRIYNYELTANQIIPLSIKPGDVSSANSMVAHYKLDEIMDVFAINMSSFGFDGVLNNFDFASSGGIDGVKGMALGFDGIDDYVQARSEGFYSESYARFTFACFASFEQVDVEQVLITRQDGTGVGYAMIKLLNTGEVVSCYGGGTVQTGFFPNIGEWHHYAIIYDSYNKSLKVYVDGSVQVVSTVPTGTATGDYIFGADKLTTSGHLNGSMDDIRIYNYARSSSEVNLMSIHPKYNAPSNSLITHYKLDETVGTVAENASTYGFDGTLNNFDFASSGGVNGVRGASLSFDGSNDHINASEDGFINTQIYNRFTLTCFAKFNQVDKEQVLATRQDGTGVGHAMIKLLNTGEVVSCYGGGTVQTGFFPNVGEWHHYAMTYDNGSLKVYVNGQVKVTTSVTDQKATGDFIFGADKTLSSMSGRLNGVLDDIRIYNYDLDLNELALLTADLWEILGEQEWRGNGRDSDGVVMVVDKADAHQIDNLTFYSKRFLVKLGSRIAVEAYADLANEVINDALILSQIPVQMYTMDLIFQESTTTPGFRNYYCDLYKPDHILYLDLAQYITINNTTRISNMLNPGVLIHEAGHSLGIDHVFKPTISSGSIGSKGYQSPLNGVSDCQYSSMYVFPLANGVGHPDFYYRWSNKNLIFHGPNGDEPLGSEVANVAGWFNYIRDFDATDDATGAIKNLTQIGSVTTGMSSVANGSDGSRAIDMATVQTTNYDSPYHVTEVAFNSWWQQGNPSAGYNYIGARSFIDPLSSTLTWDTKNYVRVCPPITVIDKNINTTVSETNQELNPWWQCDLPEIKQINYISVYMGGQQSNLSDLKISVFQDAVEIYSKVYTTAEYIETLNASDRNVVHLYFSGGKLGNKVRVELVDTGMQRSLKISEVKVMGYSVNSGGKEQVNGVWQTTSSFYPVISAKLTAAEIALPAQDNNALHVEDDMLAYNDRLQTFINKREANAADPNFIAPSSEGINSDLISDDASVLATQSSTSGGNIAEQALDDDSSTLAGTESELAPWWKISFQQPQRLRRLELKLFGGYVNDTTYTISVFKDGNRVYVYDYVMLSHPEILNLYDWRVILLPSELVGDEIKIEKMFKEKGVYRKSQVLQINEVRVYKGQRQLNIFSANGTGSASDSEVRYVSGNGDFENISTLGSSVENEDCIATADFNEDGYTDVVVGSNSLGQKTGRCYFGNSNGSFSLSHSSAFAVCISDTSVCGFGSVAVGDFNNDGHYDLLTSGSRDVDNSFCYFYAGDGNGSFELPVEVLSGTSRAIELKTGYVNDDSDLDMIWLEIGGQLNYALGNGDGTFGTGTPGSNHIELVAEDLNMPITDFALHDLDSDGDLDFVVVYDNGQNTCHLSNGDGTFTGTTNFGTGSDTSNAVSVGDVNEDGYVDILIFNNGSQNVCYFGDATQSYTNSVNFGSGVDHSIRGSVAEVADMNGDTHLDIIYYVGSSDTGSDVIIYFGDGLGGFSTLKGISNLAKTFVLSDPLDSVYTLPIAANNTTYGTNVALLAEGATAINGWGNVTTSLRAIDASLNTVSLTLGMTPWWEVQLGVVRNIGKVNIFSGELDYSGTDLTNFNVIFYNDGVEVHRYHHGGTVPKGGHLNLSNLNVAADKIRIKLNFGPSRFLALKEVEVYETDVTERSALRGDANIVEVEDGSNIALSSKGAIATQSSTFNNLNYGSWVASRAIDDNTSGWWSSESISRTANEAGSWWGVTLLQKQAIKKIVIYADLSNVSMSNFDVEVYSDNTLVMSHSVSRTLGIGEVLVLDVNGVCGNVVKIVTKTGTQRIILSEVQVYGTTVTERSALRGDADIVSAEDGSNAVLGSTASQSSTFVNTWNGSWEASRAIDGDDNAYFAHGSVSSTVQEAGSWWEVDLPSLSTVNKIVIYGHAGMWKNLHDFDIEIYSGNTRVMSYRINRTLGASEVLILEGYSGIVGDRVRIVSVVNQMLILPEVEVYTTP